MDGVGIWPPGPPAIAPSPPDTGCPAFALTLAIAIRRTRERDLAALEWFGLFSSHRDIIRAAFDRQMLGDMEMLVADLNGFPVGQVWIDFRPGRAEDGASLWAVRVLPPLRRLGIGQRLMRAAEVLARDRGLAVTSLTVERRNTEARKLYERLGYRIVDPPPAYGDGAALGGRDAQLLRTQWLMRKRLDDAATDAGHAGGREAGHARRGV